MSDHDLTEQDSERYLGGEGDSNQLPREDTLVDRAVDDLLDEGYSPPDYPRSNHYGETPLEELTGESLEQRVREEEPEVWQRDRPPTGREADRAGRLVEDDDTWRRQDLYGKDAGVAGGAASAEEAAMHIVTGEETDDDDGDDDGDEFPAPAERSDER